MASSSSLDHTLIKLVEIEGKGRGFVASQPLKGGQIILQESPILTFSAFPLKHSQQQEVASSITPSSSSSTKYCSHCFCSLSSEEFPCPSCCHSNDTIFCSSECRSLALSTTHTPWVCEALRQLRHCSLLVEHQPEEHQVQARYLVQACNLAINFPYTFEKLLSLHGDDKKDMETAKFLHSIISSFLSFPEGFSAPSVEVIAALLNKESCNSFSLMEPFLESGGRTARAYGIYINASFFNHDCLPNACRFDYLDNATKHEKNTDIIIRMIHDVPQGEEICLSYFRVGLNYDERKKRLMDYFGFACHCDRCKVEMELGYNENYVTNKHEICGVDLSCAKFFGRFLCERVNCGGTLAPLPHSNANEADVMECNFCGNLIKNKM